jgi:UDP-N-acetyl-D-mannosaminuronate dehydrogenase
MWRRASTRPASSGGAGVCPPEAAEPGEASWENTFRAVNIGLVNEIAIVCDKLGVDVWEVIDARRPSRSAT